jgi:TonB family protein
MSHQEYMKRLKFNWSSIVLAFASVLAQSPAQEPLRAGIDVPEPKLIKKVDIHHTEADMIARKMGRVVLKLLVDEQGAVADIKDIISFEAFQNTVKTAVKKWRFSQTFVNGKAVPVTATVVFDFSLFSIPFPIDLGKWMLCLSPIDACFFPVIMNRAGKLKEEPQEDLYKVCAQPAKKLIPESDVPFSLLERRMKQQGPQVFYDLWTTRYRFPNSGSLEYTRPGLKRLYYSTLLTSNGSQLVQLVGVDPDVKSPKFDIDFNRLAESLKDSRHINGSIHFFTIFVDEAGNILGVESTTKNEAVVKTLSNATVTASGTRKGKPVPTAVIVAIMVK